MQARQSVNNSPILGAWNILAVLLMAATLVATDLLTPDEIEKALNFGPRNVCGQKMNHLMANYCNPQIRRLIETGKRSKKSGESLTESSNPFRNPFHIFFVTNIFFLSLKYFACR